MYYRNTGAPIPRTFGANAIMVPTNAVFEPTPQELRQFGYKLTEVGATPPPGAQVVGPIPAPPPQLPPEWPIPMLPDLYLRLHPDGPHAALAQRIIARMSPRSPVLAPAPVPQVPPVDISPEKRTRPTVFGGKPKPGKAEEMPHGPDE